MSLHNAPTETPFQEESEVLAEAQRSLEEHAHDPQRLGDSMVALISEYKKLLRKSRRVTKIGDSAQKHLMDARDDLSSALNQVEELNVHLMRLSKEKDEFLRIVAHDLKNPIGGIRGMAELIYEEPDIDRDEVEEYMRDTIACCHEVLGVLADLVDMQAYEKGRFKLTLTFVQASAILAEVQAGLKPLASRKEQIIRLDLEHDIELRTDRQKIGRILENLVSNAIKFSEKNTTITVRAYRQGDVIRFAVEDQGPGLTAEDQTKLFKEGQRISNSPTGGEASSGYGLPVVKRLVDTLNGRCGCESVRGEGSTFWIEVPQSSATHIPFPLKGANVQG